MDGLIKINLTVNAYISGRELPAAWKLRQLIGLVSRM
jgi:hypothetical protein